MGIASPGVGSNLDINAIISSLMQAEARPLLLLDQKEAVFQAQLSGYGSLKGAISSFQSAVKDLSTSSKYQNIFATPSDLTKYTASADTTAVPGSYALETTTLATQQKLVATGQANATDSIGTGTLTFDFGTISGGTLTSGKYTGASFATNGSGIKTVIIDSTNDSLSGIRDAINAAAIGVTATIIDDGTASPKRLSLTSDTLGLANSIKISVSGDAALDTLIAHDPAATQNLTQTVTATDAAFTVDGVSITKSTNTVTDVIQGVTLNLLDATTSAITLTVSQDKETVKTSVEKFVSEFNSITAIIDNLTLVDPDTEQGGLLQGDTSASSINTRIKRVVTSALTALTGSLTSLTDIGVSFQTDGTLSVDSTKLQTAIDTNYDELAGLFVAQGKPTDSLVKYVSATDDTTPGSYAVNITTLATRGTTVGSAAAGLTITTGVDDTIIITVDDASATITLAAGTYASASTLAAEVQSKINGSSTFSDAGISVTVSESAGVLTITSDGYGSSSKVDVTGGNGETNLVGVSSINTNGLNVAGTINGGAATGFGQFLTVSTGNDAEGLKIQITGGATGSRGTVEYTEGYAYQLEALTSEILDISTGSIVTRTNGINARIEDITEDREDINARLVTVEARYRQQFSALDILLSEFSTTSNFLTQQLDALAKIPKSGTK